MILKESIMELKYVLDYMKHRKEMEKQGKGSQAKVGFIKGLIDKKTEDIIATRGEDLRTIERIRIKREVEADLKKSIRRVGLTIAAMGLAAGIGAKASNVLTEGKYKEIEITENGVNIDTAKVGDINLKLDEASNTYHSINISKNDFDESLRIDINNLEQIQNAVAQDEILKESVENEVDNLKTFDDGLNYLKGMYVEKYNQENHTDYKADDIMMRKHTNELLESQAQNGDEILRILSSYSPDFVPIVNQVGYLEIKVKQENETIKTLERGTILKDEYKNVYGLNEEVLEDKEINEIGKVLYTGLNYCIALDHKEENSIKTMQKYKERFKSAILEYKQAKIDEIVNSKTAEETSQIENDEEERY